MFANASYGVRAAATIATAVVTGLSYFTYVWSHVLTRRLLATHLTRWPPMSPAGGH